MLASDVWMLASGAWGGVLAHFSGSADALLLDLCRSHGRPELTSLLPGLAVTAVWRVNQEVGMEYSLSLK